MNDFTTEELDTIEEGLSDLTTEYADNVEEILRKIQEEIVRRKS